MREGASSEGTQPTLWIFVGRFVDCRDHSVYEFLWQTRWFRVFGSRGHSGTNSEVYNARPGWESKLKSQTKRVRALGNIRYTCYGASSNYCSLPRIALAMYTAGRCSQERSTNRTCRMPYDVRLKFVKNTVVGIFATGGFAKSWVTLHSPERGPSQHFPAAAR